MKTGITKVSAVGEGGSKKMKKSKSICGQLGPNFAKIISAGKHFWRQVLFTHDLPVFKTRLEVTLNSLLAYSSFLNFQFSLMYQQHG